MTETITSSQNTKIKLVRGLQTQRKNRSIEASFVAEGVRLIEDAVQAKWPIEFVLYDETLSERGQTLLNQLQGREGLEIGKITPDLMRKISDTESPQGILAVLRSQEFALPKSPTFLILADQIRDPGNLGTLLRTAEAVGADAVFLPPGTVDAFSPKVVRAGMGAHFRLPIHHLSWDKIKAYLGDLPVYLAESSNGMPLWRVDFTKPCALLVGGEAYGASPEGVKLATLRVTIPMPGRTESLNAAIAAGILMAEIMRQRYQKD